jgi:putative nucleic acid modification protein with dual OB domain
VERVLIVAKTRMHNAACVSGLTRDTNSSIRLLRPDRSNQLINTSFDVGQVWELEFHQSPQNTPPHVEDVIVTRERYIGTQTNLRTILMQRVKLWQGEPGQLFDGLLVIDITRGYISRSTGIPKSSTGYWLPNRPLTLTYRNEKPYYQIKYDIYDNYKGTLSIPYVGFADPIQQIPLKTLVRISLARWWVPAGMSEEKCYLQLSGWYL